MFSPSPVGEGRVRVVVLQITLTSVLSHRERKYEQPAYRDLKLRLDISGSLPSRKKAS